MEEMYQKDLKYNGGTHYFLLMQTQVTKKNTMVGRTNKRSNRSKMEKRTKIIILKNINIKWSCHSSKIQTSRFQALPLNPKLTIPRVSFEKYVH